VEGAQGVRIDQGGFADCLIERTCHDAICEYTATLDTKAAKLAGLPLIKYA
jgi:hypothetical protein